MSPETTIKVEQYLKHVEKLARTILGENLVSLVVFGSFVRGELSKSSDIDILIAVKDRIHPSVAELMRKLYALEQKYGFSFCPKGFFGKLFYSLSRATGMFRSIFIAEAKAIKNWEFSKVFNTSVFMTSLLAPKEAVKFTILSAYKVIYGSDPLKDLSIKEPNHVEIIKSLLMNLLLALASFVLLPLHRETYKFIYEAVKWSLFCYAYSTQRKPVINELLKTFYKKSKRDVEGFIATHKNNKLDSRLLLYGIPMIIKIHIQSLKELKRRQKSPRHFKTFKR
ncbi:MAG: nucleotidyltransferase domain-containing protein [Crenarchaeota archaeon]|nr:nucleotidyltransferase domain-containing protein [Thermoproteota archaeon]MCR8455225.1 nucleotidyltransferase domain-containing protein [Thermoproteota archaeon]